MAYLIAAILMTLSVLNNICTFTLSVVDNSRIASLCKCDISYFGGLHVLSAYAELLVCASLHATFSANFIKTADVVQWIQQFKL